MCEVLRITFKDRGESGDSIFKLERKTREMRRVVRMGASFVVGSEA